VKVVRKRVLANNRSPCPVPSPPILGVQRGNGIFSEI
jgi:hypothetical protein